MQRVGVEAHVFSSAGMIRIRFTGPRAVSRNLSRKVRHPEDVFTLQLFSIVIGNGKDVNQKVCQVFSAPSQNIQAVRW